MQITSYSGARFTLVKLNMCAVLCRISSISILMIFFKTYRTLRLDSVASYIVKYLTCNFNFCVWRVFPRSWHASAGIPLLSFPPPSILRDLSWRFSKQLRSLDVIAMAQIFEGASSVHASVTLFSVFIVHFTYCSYFCLLLWTYWPPH